MDCSPPGSSVHGILQARILEWAAISFPGGSSWPKDWTRIFRLAGGFFATEPPRKSTRQVLLFFKHWNYSAWRDVSILLGLGRLKAESIQSLILVWAPSKAQKPLKTLLLLYIVIFHIVHAGPGSWVLQVKCINRFDVTRQDFLLEWSLLNLGAGWHCLRGWMYSDVADILKKVSVWCESEGRSTPEREWKFQEKNSDLEESAPFLYSLGIFRWSCGSKLF